VFSPTLDPLALVQILFCFLLPIMDIDITSIHCGCMCNKSHNAFVSDKVQDVGESVTVQVVGIEEYVAPKGGRRVIIKISDGVYHLGCFLSPKLFEMLDSEILSLYSVISINHVSSMTHTEDITLIILDALVVLTLDGVLGSPITCSKLTQKHSATDTTSSCKRQRCDDHNVVQNSFFSIMRR
jgi:hypothetical protein